MKNCDLLSDKLKAVYDCLQDEESKAIFMAKLCYFYTGEWRYMHDMVESAILFAGKRKRKFEPSNSLVMFDDFIKTPNYREREIVLYGAGISLDLIYPIFERFGLKCSAICDSNPQKIGTVKYGFTIISPKHLVENFINATVIVTGFFGSSEIIKYLLVNGFTCKNIISMLDKNEMYFGPEFMQPEDEEYYIDVGLGSIRTINQFIRFCKESGTSYNKILAFEPSIHSFNRCTKKINELGYKNITILNKGAYSSKRTLRFSPVGNGVSRIEENGPDVIETITIDEAAGSEKVTLIKMDIEGAELEALKGCAETIRTHKPRLAISIYHKPEDIIDIPSYINHLVPEYRFWIRQYSYFTGETVLYCVI